MAGEPTSGFIAGRKGEPDPSEAEGTHVWVRSEEGLR